MQNIIFKRFQKKLYQIVCRDISVFEFTQKYGKDCMLIWDSDDPDDLWINPALSRILEPEQPPPAIKDVIPAADIDRLLTRFNSQLNQAKEEDIYEIRFRTGSSSVIKSSWRIKLFRDENGDADKLIGVSDFSAGKLTGNSTHQENDFVVETKKSFVQNSITTTAMLDKDMCFLAASKAWLNNFHSSEIDVSSKSYYDLFPQIPEERREIHRKSLEGETFQGDESLFSLGDGKQIWLNWSIRPWFKANRGIGGVIIEATDITRLKNMEKLYFERGQFLQTILDNVDTGIIACNKNGELTLFNKTTRSWHGLPARDIPTSEFADHYGLYHSDGTTPLKTEEIPLLQVLNTGRVKNKEIIIKPRKGETRIVTCMGARLFDESEKVAGAVIAMQDITGLKKREKALKISESIFRSNFEYAAVGMIMLDPAGNWFKFNNRFLEITGYTAEELTSLHFNQISHPEELADNQKLFEEVFEGKRQYYNVEKRVLHKEGYYVPTIVSGSLVRDEDNIPLYSIAQILDVTRQKTAEDNLKDTLVRMEAILDSSIRTIIVGTDTSGMINFYNKGAEKLLGYTSKEVVGKMNPGIFHVPEELIELEKKLSTPNKPVRGFDIFKKLIRQKKYTREWTLVKKDATPFYVQLVMTAIRHREKVIGYLVVGTDISDLKKAKNEIKSVLKITQNQNDRLKNFAHIVSHNLRSHSGNLSMLLDLYTGENPEAAEDEMIIHLKTAAQNLSETISHLNEVVLMNTAVGTELNNLNLYDYTEAAISNVSGIASKKNVEIENNIPKDLGVLALPAYLESIILNFLTNGIKYRSPDRKAYIKLDASRVGKYVQVEIEDNGLGIDLVKNKSKMFGMYKTFHSNKDSRGIGLFITKNQIETMGGKIEVESEVKQGTTFKIYLQHEKY